MGFIDRIAQRFSRSSTPMSVDEAIGQAETLSAAGRARDAVALLHDHALRSDDVRPHALLTAQRRVAAREATAAARPRPDWPPTLADPFPGLTGIPQIERDALTPDTMGGAILHHGSLLVRGMLNRDEAQTFAADIDRTFEAFDRVAASDSGQSHVDPWIWWFDIQDAVRLAHTRAWNRKGGGVWAADSPRLFSRLVELYERYGLLAAIEGYLGERPLASVGKTVLRRVSPTNPGDFHQDGAFLGVDTRTVNVWIALSDCGVDAPGLEVVDRRVPEILQTGIDGANYPWSVGREAARHANGGQPIARPVFQAGDALIFDQFMLHATSWAPEMNRQRFAIESWFFAPSAATDDQIPLFV